MSNEQWSEWIEWNGGKCPLKAGERCCVKYRNGEVRNDVPAGADMGLVTAGGYDTTNTYWRNDGRIVDIIAYRYRLDDNTMSPEEEEIPAKEWAGSITDSEDVDMVSHPPHYQSDNGIECIDAIRAALGKEGFIAYCRGNVIKYSWRIKANPAEDQGKAAWYANKAREALEE